jgi:hypothetical protein
LRVVEVEFELACLCSDISHVNTST